MPSIYPGDDDRDDRRPARLPRPGHHHRNSRPITRPTAREIRLAPPPAAAGFPAPLRFTRHHTERLSRRALARCTATRATARRPWSPIVTLHRPGAPLQTRWSGTVHRIGFL